VPVAGTTGRPSGAETRPGGAPSNGIASIWMQSHKSHTIGKLTGVEPKAGTSARVTGRERTCHRRCSGRPEPMNAEAAAIVSDSHIAELGGPKTQLWTRERTPSSY